MSEVASLVHTRKHQQVSTHFGFLVAFLVFFLSGMKKQLSLSLSPASPSALVLMNVELLTLAMRRMTARGQLNIFNDTLLWPSPV